MRRWIQRDCLGGEEHFNINREKKKLIDCIQTREENLISCIQLMKSKVENFPSPPSLSHLLRTMSKGSKPKKKKGETINVYDSTAVKASLDAYVCKVLETKKSLSLDQTLSNIRIVVTFLAVSMAVIAQFYPAKFPDNWNALIICCPV